MQILARKVMLWQEEACQKAVGLIPDAVKGFFSCEISVEVSTAEKSSWLTRQFMLHWCFSEQGTVDSSWSKTCTETERSKIKNVSKLFALSYSRYLLIIVSSDETTLTAYLNGNRVIFRTCFTFKGFSVQITRGGYFSVLLKSFKIKNIAWKFFRVGLSLL